jgi:hypothetical protein
LDSLEENISYTLIGKYNLMLYPYITYLTYIAEKVSKAMNPSATPLQHCPLSDHP